MKPDDIEGEEDNKTNFLGDTNLGLQYRQKEKQ